MEEKNLAHNVFFTLKDASDKTIENLIEECYTYLKDLPGIINFSAGRIVPENNREVNVADFHVGLHVIFSDKNVRAIYENTTNRRNKHGCNNHGFRIRHNS